MNSVQAMYVDRVNRIRDGQEAICNCCVCDTELFYGYKVFKFDGDTYCENCFDNLISENFEYELGMDDIPEPDWDSLPGGHDHYDV